MKCYMLLNDTHRVHLKIPEIACWVLIIVNKPNQFIFIVSHKLSVGTNEFTCEATQISYILQFRP